MQTTVQIVVAVVAIVLAVATLVLQLQDQPAHKSQVPRFPSTSKCEPLFAKVKAMNENHYGVTLAECAMLQMCMAGVEIASQCNSAPGCAARANVMGMFLPAECGHFDGAWQTEEFGRYPIYVVSLPWKKPNGNTLESTHSVPLPEAIKNRGVTVLVCYSPGDPIYPTTPTIMSVPEIVKAIPDRIEHVQTEKRDMCGDERFTLFYNVRNIDREIKKGSFAFFTQIWQRGRCTATPKLTLTYSL